MAIGFGSAATRANLRLSLELTEPDKSGDTWSVTATAIVSDPQGPMADVEVQFYVDSQAVDSPQPTEGDGRVRIQLTDLTKGKRLIEATIVGSTVRSKRTINLKDKDPKQANEINVSRSGHRGSYRLEFTVLDDKGRGMKDTPVKIIDDANPSASPDELTTNERGVATTTITFTEREKRLVVSVPGAPQTRKKIVLYGARRRRS